MALITLESLESIKEISIEEIGLPLKTLSCLKRAHVNSVGDLLNIDKNYLTQLAYTGQLSINEIEGALEAYLEKAAHNDIETALKEKREANVILNQNDHIDDSILELDLNANTYYALKLANLDTVREIISQEKSSIKKRNNRINDIMLKDIDDAIISFGKSHDCLKEVLAFPFF